MRTPINKTIIHTKTPIHIQGQTIGTLTPKVLQRSSLRHHFATNLLETLDLLELGELVTQGSDGILKRSCVQPGVQASVVAHIVLDSL